MFYKLLNVLVVVGLLLSPLTSVRVSAANSDAGVVLPQNSLPQHSLSQTASASTVSETARAFWEAPDARPLMNSAGDDAAQSGAAALANKKRMYRTTVRIRGDADLARLKQLKIKILTSDADSAVVLLTRTKLKKLAKLSFMPRDTELVTRLKANNGAQIPESATVNELLLATAVDTDSDGLNDNEEAYWCTNPNVADSDNDRVPDGVEVDGLRDWILHNTATRPASGKPFAGWPPNHNGCYDSDYDSVPDAVEVFVFGLNPNRESTARDKFDDGQKLFGLTNCPGSGGGCGYGALPRLVDWGVIFAEMPSWVKPPYDSPFVAAFPDPDVQVVAGSFVVTAKTTITTDRTVSEGEAKTYGTSETRGTSTSVADTVTWNQWSEISTTKPIQSTRTLSQEKFFVRTVSSNNNQVKLQATRTLFAGIVAVGGCAVGAAAATTVVLAVAGGVVCAAALGGAAVEVAQLVDDMSNVAKDQADKKSAPKCTGTPAESSQISCNKSSHIPTGDETTKISKDEDNSQNRTAGGSGTIYYSNNQSKVQAQPLYSASFSLTQLPTRTETNGSSIGGAQTTTHTEYQEHTISESSTKQFGQSWSNATALDTAHAADLTFTYKLANQGTDYAREIGEIAFNIYIGDDPNPIYTYFPAADIGGAGKFTNFMPGETHQYASRAVPLTLDQMRAIDTGESIYIVAEDYSYGVDELFYQDAVNSGATFHVDSGDGILHSYVLPTWGSESIQDVAKRFFSSTEDTDGDLLSLSVPHFDTTTPTWVPHALYDNAWWNLYLNNLGDGSAPFKSTPASANSMVLIRMNKDTDRDGYSDRTETALGTDLNDPVSHPTPQLTAVTRSVRTGDDVTVTMSFLNGGNYDAYGIEAVSYSPDATTTISNNTIGGSGRVRSGQQVVLGSRILDADTTNWRGTSKPFSAGSYTGNADRTFTFKALNAGNIGQGTVNIQWTNGVITRTVDFGAAYNNPPNPKTLTDADGLQVGFNTGTVNVGDTFTVAAQLPRDTFQYHINTGVNPYTKPVVVVSYNDPQGNHKFVTQIEVSNLGDNIAPYADDMLFGVGVDIATTAPFNTSGSNTVYLVANSPDSTPITDGHVFVEFVDDAGNVVSEQNIAATFQPGPNVQSVNFNGNAFPNFASGHDYTLLAFFTDSQGNIIDSHARLFSTFAQDPAPELNTSPTPQVGWNFGTVTQGATPQQTISLVNTGIMPLNVVVSASDPKISLTNATGIISIPPAGTHDVVAALDTDTLSGSVAMNITVRSNDPAHQTTTIPVNGTVGTTVVQANAFDVDNQPLTKRVRVYGNVSQFSTADFSHNITPDAASVEPCLIKDADGNLKGLGKYCADFNVGTVSAQVFGTGADGGLTVSGNQTINNTRTALSATSSAGQQTLNVASTSGFTAGQEVLIHQTQGTNAGVYEFGKIASIGSGIFTLQNNLSNTYTQGGNSHAQVIWVPQYTNVTVPNGSALTGPAWDGMTGGILVFRSKGNVTVNGSITVSNIGFRGGIGTTGGIGAYSGEGTNGASVKSGAANGNGSGGGQCNDGMGSGGGNGTDGGIPIASGPCGWGTPGYASGSADLTNATFGGGGGGASEFNSAYSGGNGGNGGGIIFITGINISIAGSISANGLSGTGGNDPPAGVAGGGGAGGSILLKAQSANVGNNLIVSNGGNGGATTRNNGTWVYGGAGSGGRIRLEYCDTITGSTNPIASTQKLTCYIAEKPNETTVRYTVPDTVANGKNYIMQFGRRYSFPSAGTLITPTLITAQNYMTATMDALVTNVGAGGSTNLQVKVGDTTIYSATQTITQPTTINLPNFYQAVNQAVISATVGTTLSVPISVNINRQADVILTNMVLTPGADVDLAVGNGDFTNSNANASEGDTIPLNLTIHNNGAKNAASAVVGYYAGDPKNGGTLLGNSYVASVNAGSSATASFNWVTTGYTGTKVVYAFVDPPDAIKEGLETNNIISQTVYIKTKPDLQITNIAFDKTNTVVGEPIQVTVTISNTGETNAGVTTTKLDALGVLSDTLAQNLATGAVNANSTLNINTTIAPGIFATHTITLTTDIAGVITESLETNNVMTRTIYIGLNPPDIDAGGAGDTVYTTTLGYGYLNGATNTFDNTITKTVRYNGSGTVQYRFDGLQPTRAYHLDAAFFQQGDTLTQHVLFDGIDSGQTIALNDNVESNASLRVPPETYADGSVVVTFQRVGSSGPAFVSELQLKPIQYVYIDAGSASDFAYSAAQGYGYLDGYEAGSGSALNTYRSSFGSSITYQFDGLAPSKRYTVDVTMFDPNGTNRIQTISADNTAICGPFTLNATLYEQCVIPPAAYADGTVNLKVQRTNGAGPIVNEIALQELTRDVIVTPVPPTITPTPTQTNTPTSTPTPTSVSLVTVSAFAAQWSGSQIQVTWSTTSESKVSQFQLWRSPSINPASWTQVNTSTSGSNCATSSTPRGYGYTDSAVTAGQTYYYQLTWSGTTCGGASATYATVAEAKPATATPTPTNTPTNTPIAPTHTPTSTRTNTPIPPTNTPTNTSTQTPIAPTNTPTYTPIPPSNTPTATPTVCVAKPAKPTLALPPNGSTVKTLAVPLQWNGVNCASYYIVTIKNSATGTKIQTIRTAGTTATTKALTKGVTYKWQVKACNTIGCTPSVWWTFTVSSKAKQPNAKPTPTPSNDPSGFNLTPWQDDWTFVASMLNGNMLRQ